MHFWVGGDTLSTEVFSNGEFSMEKGVIRECTYTLRDLPEFLLKILDESCFLFFISI